MTDYNKLAIMYFEGTISAGEESILYSWMKSDEANRELFHKWEEEWKASLEGTFSADWMKMRGRLAAREVIGLGDIRLQRRHFPLWPVLAAAAGAPELMKAAERLPEPQEEVSGKLIASVPVLQNFAETSIGVAFTVNALANGYVLVGEKPDLSDARKILCGGYRLADIDDRVIQVRLTGLKPATRYYYRIGAHRIHYGHGYDMKVLGTEEDPRVYSFVTAGKGLKNSSFCVINDTHKRWESFGPIQDKLAVLAPSCVIWNGDASNSEEKLENQVQIYLDQPIERKDYADETPYLFCPGNPTGIWNGSGCTASPKKGMCATGTWAATSP